MNLNQSFSHWEEIRAGLLKIIDKFSKADLSYKPFPASWPAGRIMLHIADAEEGWFRYAITRELPAWPEHFTLENFPTKADITSALTEVHERTKAYLESLEEAEAEKIIKVPWGQEFPLRWIIWHVLEHEIHHRGELSLILGMLDRDGLDV